MDNTETTTQPPTEGQPPKSILAELNESVANLIKGSGPQIREIFVAKQVQDEIQRRAGLLTTFVVALTKFKQDLNRFKPDLVVRDVTGRVTSEGYSSKVVEDRKKAVEKFNRAEKILIKAINEFDYSNVAQMTKELGQGTNPDSSNKVEPEQ